MAECTSPKELQRLEGMSQAGSEKNLSVRELRRKDRERKREEQEQIRLEKERKKEELRLVLEQQKKMESVDKGDKQVLLESHMDVQISEMDSSVDLRMHDRSGSIQQTVETATNLHEDRYSKLESSLESLREDDRKQYSHSESRIESLKKADRKQLSRNGSFLEMEKDKNKDSSFKATEKSMTYNMHQSLQDVEMERIERERQKLKDIEREVAYLEMMKKKCIEDLDKLAYERCNQLKVLDQGQIELERKLKLGEEIERRYIKQSDEMDAACKALKTQRQLHLLDRSQDAERTLKKTALLSSTAEHSRNGTSVVPDTSVHKSKERQKKSKSRPVRDKSLELESMFSKIGDPVDSSTDIDEETEHEKLLKRNLTWIDGKFKKIQEENRVRKDIEVKTEVHEPFQGQRETNRVNKEYVCGQGKNRFLPQLPNIRNVKKENDDSFEQRLAEKVERLKKKEHDLVLKIGTAKSKKEKEEQRIREQKMKEDRIRKLKEQERLLIESLQEKENVLESIEKSNQSMKEQHSEDRHRKSNEEIRKPNPDKKVKKSSEEHQSDDKLRKPKEETRKPNSQEKDKKTYEKCFSFKKPTIPKLTEDTFEEWKIEVEVVLESGLYHEDIIRQEVRNSLTGNTRKILLNVDASASTRYLITKLENIYGNIRTGESVLAEFYNAKQKLTENVADWGVRIESILNTAIKKGQVKREQADEMLRNRFWRHLRSEQLKNATRVFYETEKDFETLRRKVRVEEKEMNNPGDSDKFDTKQATSQQRTDSSEQMSLMQTLLDRMKQLEEKMSTANQKGQQGFDRPQDRGHYNRGGGNSYRSNWRRGYGQRRYRGNYYDRNKTEHDRKNEERPDDQINMDKEDTKVKQKDERQEKPLN